jgi:hypothetical protein
MPINRIYAFKKLRSLAPVAHTCNSSYSGSRDQEDRGLKPAQDNRLYLENTQHKNRPGGVVEGISPEF